MSGGKWYRMVTIDLGEKLLIFVEKISVECDIYLALDSGELRSTLRSALRGWRRQLLEVIRA